MLILELSSKFKLRLLEPYDGRGILNDRLGGGHCAEDDADDEERAYELAVADVEAYAEREA
jgi:hypothetical protein